MSIPEDYADAAPISSVSAPENSEEALALEFARRNSESLLFVAAWSRWFIYTGTRWEPDETLRAFDIARAVCRDAAEFANEDRTRKGLASARTVAAVVKLAKADRRLAAVIDQWDVDPWALNTPAGVINLKNGQMRAHRRDDYMTKITAAAPGGPCPVWRGFLNRITGGDNQLEAYLQRLAGYSLTGLTREHSLAFVYGTGANGKSVFLNTVSGIMGDYHRTAPIETFTASNSDRHPTELAMLRGARLVTAVETEEGRRWAESKLKSMTGGDPISARFMRGDFFTYIPQFKLLIAGNHLPGLRSVDESIRRRIHLIPFAETIPVEERDTNLAHKLKAEWPGILQWMIDGCVQWTRAGLDAPQAVKAATAAYLEYEDAFSTWLSETCECNPQVWSSSADLYSCFHAWAARTGEYLHPQKRFSQILEARGFVPKRITGGTRGFQGIQIKPTSTTPNQ